MSAPLLEVEGLTKHFAAGGTLRRARLHAVDDVSFALEPGRITALAGESGSGKSTVARLLVRLYEPTAGRVLFEGRDIGLDRRKRAAMMRYRSQVQMIFQDPFDSLNPTKTVRHHVERPLKLHGLFGNDVEGRVLELLDTVGLVPAKHIANKYPHELSGGQRQRVGIARALAVEPRVVIADEPISMLDVSIRVGILNLMRALTDDLGIAFLYVTHDLASARYVADDILVMYAGQVVERGPVDEVLSNPLHPYTQLLIESVPEGGRLGERLEIRRGTASAAVDPAAGCRFVERCPLAIALCRTVSPELVEARPDQSARCHVTAPSSNHREDVDAQSSA